MRYPIVIEPGDENTAYGVVVPDLPGCFSAGDTLDEAVTKAKEAIESHIEELLATGEPLPAIHGLADHQANPDYAGWVWALVEIDMSRLEDVTERVNITLPRRVLHIIDEAAKRAGESRSAYLARVGVTEATRQSFAHA
ncbi:MAG: type II toxin-antitoxin system HicB family antitoxin [Oxalobacteraceae bacterium]|nr:type II toxin-antitoxin system HicB family antitoxin [Oxalobacteraceae bacterium]